MENKEENKIPTTDQMVVNIVEDIKIGVPELIKTLQESITSKNKEVTTIKEITENLRDSMQKFADSVEQIKNLGDIIDSLKETNNKLEEMRKELVNFYSISKGLNDKINLSNKKINQKDPEQLRIQALGEKETSKKKNNNNGTYVIIGVLIVMGALAYKFLF